MDTQQHSTELPPKGSDWPNEVTTADMCLAAAQFSCTRAAGHDGPHIAQGSRDQVIHAWHEDEVAR